VSDTSGGGQLRSMGKIGQGFLTILGPTRKKNYNQLRGPYPSNGGKGVVEKRKKKRRKVPGSDSTKSHAGGETNTGGGYGRKLLGEATNTDRGIGGSTKKKKKHETLFTDSKSNLLEIPQSKKEVKGKKG